MGAAVRPPARLTFLRRVSRALGSGVLTSLGHRQTSGRSGQPRPRPGEHEPRQTCWRTCRRRRRVMSPLGGVFTEHPTRCFGPGSGAPRARRSSDAAWRHVAEHHRHGCPGDRGGTCRIGWPQRGTTAEPRSGWSLAVLEIHRPCDHRRRAPAQATSSFFIAGSPPVCLGASRRRLSTRVRQRWTADRTTRTLRVTVPAWSPAPGAALPGFRPPKPWSVRCMGCEVLCERLLSRAMAKPIELETGLRAAPIGLHGGARPARRRLRIARRWPLSVRLARRSFAGERVPTAGARATTAEQERRRR